MAMDASTKKLLVALKISTADWKKEIDNIKATLRQMNTEAMAQAQQKASRAAQQNAATKQEIIDQQRLAAQAKAMAAADQAKATWQKQQQEAIKTQVAQQTLQTAELKKQQLEQSGLLKLEQQKLAIQRQQFQLQQQQLRAQQAQQRGGGGGGGFFGNVVQTLAGGFGGGLGGTVASGAAIGTIVGAATIKLLEEGIAKVKQLGNALLEATGPASQLREQFEKLAKRSGADPEDYLNKLRVATRGLATDEQLFRISNNFMQQGLKVSNDSIVKLIGTTLDLARAQGKDATQAMQALQRASLTGRTMTLAMVTGLTRQELAITGVSKALDPATRNTLQFNQVLAAMEARLKAIGTPATTLPELLTKWDNAQKNLISDTAYAATRTEGFRKAISEVSDELDDFVIKMGPAAKKFGEFIGPAIGASMVMAQQILTNLMHIAKETASALEDLFEAFGKKPSGDYVNDTVTRLTTMKGLLLTVYNIWQFIEVEIQKTLVDIEQIASSLKIMATTNPMKWADEFHMNELRSQGRYSQIDAQAMKQRQQFLQPLTSEGNVPAPAAAGKQENISTQAQAEIAKEEAKLELQIQTEKLKAELDMQMEHVDDMKALNKEQYDAGLESLADYITKEKALLTQEHNLKLQQIDQERQARLAELAQEAKGMTYKDEQGKVTNVPAMAPGVLALKKQQIQQQANLAVAAENARYRKEELAADKEAYEDEIAARRTYVEAVNKINQDGVQERIKILEQEFQQGRVGIDAYIQQRAALAAEERDLSLKGAQDVYEASKKNDEDLAKLRIAQLEDQVKYEKQVTDLVNSEGKLRLDYLTKEYEQATKLLESDIKSQAGVPGLSAVAQVSSDQSELIKIAQDYIKQLEAAQKDQDPLSEGWLRIADQIAAARDQIVQMNEQLAKSSDYAAPLSELFGEIAQDLGDSIPKSWQKMFSQMSTQLKHLSEMLQKEAAAAAAAQAGGGQAQTPLQTFTSGWKNLFKPQAQKRSPVASAAQQAFDQGLKQMTASTVTVGDVFKGTASTIEGFSGKIADASTVLTQFASAASAAIAKMSSAPGKGGAGTGGEAPSATVTAMGSEVATISSQIPNTISPSSGIGAGQTENQDMSNGSSSGGSGFSDLDTYANQSAGGLQKLAAASTTAGSQMPKFTQNLTSAISGTMQIAQGVMGTVGTIMGAKSAGSGAMGGIMSGASTGMMFGPIGAGVGATIGGIMGGIVGAKQAQITQDLQQIKQQMDGILQSLHDGTISLGQAIQDLRQEREQAVQLLGAASGGKGDKGSKKDPGQAEAAISAIDSQLQQLIQEQQQVLDQMDQQIQELAQPEAYQPIIEQLDSIIQKYQQFASAAAGNTQEVAQAQLYLNEALQQYATTVSDQLNQANQQAINDSLNLLNLEQQRYDLIENEAQQEYSIMTQGVLTRQTGSAASKGEEIAQLRYQRDQQLEQIDEQISLEQYKVAAEQKIFDLATTRIGLETQLLALQESQANEQMSNITALQNLLSAITSGALSGTTVTEANGGLATGSQLLNSILGSLGLSSPTGTVQPNYYAEIPQEWQSIAQFFDAIIPGFLSGLISAMMTDPGSSARQGVVSELAGNDQIGDAQQQGYDVSGFESWIQSGSAIPADSAVPPASYATGTPYVPEDQLALVHEGEAIIPAATAANIPATVLQGLVSGIPTGQPITAGTFSLNTSSSSTNSGSSDPAFKAAPNIRLQIENQIYQMATARAGLEMQVVSARASLLAQEQSHLLMVQDLINQMANLGQSGTTPSLETAMNQIYQLRGRYASGGFTRQQGL